MYHFCTYFDRHYLPRGLALYHSLMCYAKPFTLYVLCFDKETYTYLSSHAFPNLIPVALETFEDGDLALLEAKQNRTRLEYYYTCSPSWPLYLLKQLPSIDIITYIDSDLFFFSSPEPIYSELGKNSILIIPHRFYNAHEEELVGRYNVGYLSFRNNTIGRECLNWWRDRCLEWCYDRHEDGKFADQKYLNEWPERFKEVVVLQNKGAGLAPWNVPNHQIREDKDLVKVDSDPLVFYHFHGVKVIKPFLFNLHFYKGKVIRKKVFIPYLHLLQDIIQETGSNSLNTLRDQKRQLTWQDWVRLFLYNKPVIVVGPFIAEIHLNSLLCMLFYPFLEIRRLWVRYTQSQVVKPV